MEIVNLLTRRVAIRLGDREWPVVLNHRVLLKIEAELGISILNGDLNISQLSAKALRAILFVALSSSGATYSGREIISLLGLRGLTVARQKIVEAWIAAMPEKEPDEHQAKTDFKRHEWMEVWANNRYHLNLTDDEWLNMTPRMCQALDRQRREDRRKWDLQISRATAVTANYGFCRPKEAFRDDHFMLDPWPKADNGAPVPESVEAWHSMFFGGKQSYKIAEQRGLLKKVERIN